MPIKKHLAHQTRYLLQAADVFSLPEWAHSKIFRVVLCGAVSILCFVYVVQMSRVSVSGYQIRTLEKNIERLTREQQKLEVSVIEKNSISAINKRVDSLIMVPAKNVIKLDKTPVVARGESK